MRIKTIVDMLKDIPTEKKEKVGDLSRYKENVKICELLHVSKRKCWKDQTTIDALDRYGLSREDAFDRINLIRHKNVVINSIFIDITSEIINVFVLCLDVAMKSELRFDSSKERIASIESLMSGACALYKGWYGPEAEEVKNGDEKYKRISEKRLEIITTVILRLKEDIISGIKDKTEPRVLYHSVVHMKLWWVVQIAYDYLLISGCCQDEINKRRVHYNLYDQDFLERWEAIRYKFRLNNY